MFANLMLGRPSVLFQVHVLTLVHNDVSYLENENKKTCAINGNQHVCPQIPTSTPPKAQPETLQKLAMQTMLLMSYITTRHYKTRVPQARLHIRQDTPRKEPKRGAQTWSFKTDNRCTFHPSIP